MTKANVEVAAAITEKSGINALLDTISRNPAGTVVAQHMPAGMHTVRSHDITVTALYA